MIILKKWSDFDECRKESDRLLAIYGAGIVGRNIVKTGIASPDYFCDKNADKIEAVTDENGKKIPVIALDKLIGLKTDIDLIFGIMNTKLDIKNILEDVINYLKHSEQRIYVYWLDVNNDIEPFSFGGKLVNNKNVNYQFIREQIFSYENKQKIRNAFIDSDTLTEDDYKAIYGDVFAPLFLSDSLAHVDLKSRHINFINGKRHTVGQPENYNNRCLVFGDSRIQGSHSQDKYTICSQLQAMLNEKKLSHRYLVENEAIQGASLTIMLLQLKQAKLCPGDIILFVKPHHLLTGKNSGVHLSNEEGLYYFISIIAEANKYCMDNQCFFVFIEAPTINHRNILSPWEECLLNEGINPYKLMFKFMCGDNRNALIQRPDCTFKIYLSQYGIMNFGIDPEFYYSKHTIFIDLLHWGDYGNKILAKQMFQIITAIIKSEKDYLQENKYSVKLKEINQTEISYMLKLIYRDVDKYIENICSEYPINLDKNAGAIVMNCNPFTKGHRYLIEQAADISEILYIFVVQEDLSDFKFEDRFRLVCENTKDLLNVVVIPSGKFIISSFTFPGYFSKENVVKGYEPDSNADLLLFSTCIAPALNIKTRFVGEEPYCMTTKHYNQQMKEILPQYGVDVLEIPRISASGAAISASRVRKLLADGNIQELASLVPPSTYQYLITRYTQ